MDPFDPRWQGTRFEKAGSNLAGTGHAEQSIRISRWFDPPFISPRQEAVALPLSLAGMFSAFSVV